MGHIIKSVPEGSLGAELGLLPGDELLTLNGEPVVDVIDYQALLSTEELALVYRRGGETLEVDCEKEEWEELGVEFADGLLTTRVCKNHCIFCFIDQMPPNCRPTLYVKDDDWRMSLMMGNFVTLTNVDEEEMRRIVRRRASPLYISVHATDPEVRRRMMRNPHAGRILDQLRTLQDAGLQFHCQIVLCPGENDGDVLERTLTDLAALRPAAQSVAVVPVGLTGFRQGLYPLRPFTREEADGVLRQISRWQKKCWKEMGTRFVFASDEFYCLAGRSIPAESCYEDFPQIENGVGLLRRFECELEEAERFEVPDGPAPARRYLIPTGVSAAPHLMRMAERFAPPGVSVRVLPVPNHFFGETVTVTGLLTGGDVLAALTPDKVADADELLLCSVMLRHEGDLFLDDMHIDDFRRRAPLPLHVTGCDGQAFYDALRGHFDD